jgi:magnesium-transporting ATPase (P-type)
MPKPTSLTTQQPWHHWDIEQVLTHLQSQREGLSYVVARQRLRRYGRNRLPRKLRISQIAFQPLANPYTYALIAIAAAVQYLGSEGWPLLLIGVFHAVVGIWLTAWVNQFRTTTLSPTFPAESKDNASNNSDVVETTVWRDGESMDIPSRDLVVGDIVAISSGDHPNVDIRLLETDDLQVDQTSLGVETALKQAQTALPQSTPPLERSNIIYAGTTITSGKGVGIVVAAGRHVYAQKVVRHEQPFSAMHYLLRRLRWLWFGTISVAIAGMVGITIYRGETDWYDIGFLGIAIAISTYPQNLLRIATLTQLRGIHSLAQKRLQIKFPSVIDALARISIITLILEADTPLSIENLTKAGIKWHGLIRASESDANALGETLGIGVSSYFEAPIEMIRAWQSDYQSRRTAVAMIGKDPEDIPLLRQADVGICVRTCAKEVQDSAGLILPGEYFHYIAVAIAEGRSVFDRIQRMILLLSTTTTSLIVLILVSLYINAVIIPLQIIWSGAIATPLLALTFILEPTSTNIITRPARQFQSILRFSSYLRLGIAIFVLCLAVGAVFWFQYRGISVQLPEARTTAFTTLLLGQIFYACSLCRTSIITNLPLITVIAFLIAAQAAIVNISIVGEVFATVPLDPTQWAIAALAATSVFWVEELIKPS